MAALVGSTDGMLGQYAAHISTCDMRVEPVETLTEGMGALLEAFAARNGANYPRRIIVYRDGLAENQFQACIENEVAAFKTAIKDRGLSAESVQMAVVVCQKRHHTRLVYQAGPNSDPQYQNPCVGLVVDDTITSASTNEFFLNSHTPVLGTSKACKYSLIYDEIGLEVCNLFFVIERVIFFYAFFSTSVRCQNWSY